MEKFSKKSKKTTEQLIVKTQEVVTVRKEKSKKTAHEAECNYKEIIVTVTPKGRMSFKIKM
jgi:hypothetical protein